MVELITVLMLVMIVAGSLANHTAAALVLSIIFAVLVRMIWYARCYAFLRSTSADAEDQLQLDIELLETCKRNPKLRGISDMRGIGHAIRQRQRNLAVLRAMYITQSHSIRAGSTMLGVATFLSPWVGITVFGVYALTRIMPIRRLMRTV
jgi:membrane protein implicated in regulation of membrane protease activity